MIKFYNKIGFLLLTICFFANIATAQVNYNDGPIRLRVWVHKVWSNTNCGDIGDQEYLIRDIRARTSNVASGYITSPAGLALSFWGDENRYYSMSQLHSASVPGGVPLEANGYRLLDVSYSGTQVPSQFDVYVGSAYENDCYGDLLSCGDGSEFSYEGCCCLFGVCALSDDYLYTGSGWTTVNFRGGREGQVNYSQPVVYRQNDEHSYAVVYAYQWDWTGNVKALCGSPNYQDGPITVTTDLIGVFADSDWDGGFCGINTGGNEDLRVKVLAKDNLTGSFGNFPTGLGSAIKISQDIPRWNSLFSNSFTRTYTIADVNMQSVHLAWDLWEEDSYDYGSVFGIGLNCGTDDNYEGTDYAFPYLCINGDDVHIVSRVGAPGTTVNVGYDLNWRESPPNTFNTIDVPVRIGNGRSQNWFLRFRYRWTIAAPTVSINTTDLSGCIGTPITYSAANVSSTNATYFQWQVANVTSSGAGTCPVGATWTNVAGAVCPNISFPQVAGTRVYRLIVYNRNGTGSTTSSGPKYDSAVSSCLRVTYFPFAPPIISTACGKTVPSGGTITFTVPTPPASNAIASGATYNWTISPTTNVSPTSGTGTIFSPTFTSAAAGTTYTVTLTIVDACGATNATSNCSFLVSTPSCDQIYVAPAANGGSDANPGTASQPYLTIANAIANISGSRTHVHIMGGATYNNEPQWIIPTNAIIDGGWEIVSLANNDWRKNSSLTTTVNLNPSLENDGTQGFYRGIVSNGNNWLLQDLTLNVKNGANQPNVTFTQFNNKGCTIYGVYANGTSGWEIKRTTINTGTGTNGATGSTPSGTGGAGGGGTGGGGGGNGSLTGCYGSGQTNGGAGGSGTANNGTAGAGGSGGNWTTGGDCNIVGCDANGSTGGTGGNAPNYGQAGGPTIGIPNYAPGARPATPGVASLFYQPSGQAATGGSGGAGGRGGGGGGGDVGTCCLSCPFAGCGWSRPNGGSGGNGGGGGIGGTGGYGAGGSFGLYVVNGSSGNLTNSIVNLSAGGTGGAGATGQSGGSGQAGAAGVASNGCDGNGNGGTGGRGGDGAPGGRGQDGANGLAQSIVPIASTIVQTNSTPNGPNPVADFLKARYYKGCTNSYIEIQKGAGTTTSPGFDTTAMTASVINDQSPNTTSYQYTATGALTTYVQFYTQGWKQEKLLTQNGWTTFIRIIETRSLPTIQAAPKRICSGQTTSFSITSNNPNQDYSNTAADYEWKYRIYKDGNVRRTPDPAWTTGTGAGPNTITLTNTTSDSITYLIGGRVRDKCCGWSIWVFDTVVVFPAINPANAWTSVPANGSNICIKGAPATLSVNIPTGQSGGVAGSAYFIYRYSTDGGVSWTTWSTTRPTAIVKVIGSTIVESAYVSPTSPAGCDTAYTTVDINWIISDSVQAIAGVVDVAACGTPNSAAIISAVAPATGTGQWTQISGTSISSPATPTSTPTLNISGVPFNTNNNIYRWTVTNGACSDFTDVTITTPTIITNAITMQSDACYTCTINDGVTYSYYDFSGKIIATIEDYTPPVSELGSTEVCTHIHPYVQQTWTVAYPDSQPYLQRYWTISPGTSTNAKITLYFTAAEYNALQLKAAGGAYAFSTINDLRVSKFPGGGGGSFTPPHVPGGEMLTAAFTNWAGNGTDYQATFDCNTFSTFYIHPVRFPYEVLPVELLSFTGSNVGDRNRLEWITASEKNTNRFEVEKSIDGINWFYIGEKPAAGNSTQRLTYELFDNFPVVGNNYYRLKSIDNDASFSYSKIVNIILSSVNSNSGIIGAYPNPTSNDINVVISSNVIQNASLKVYDVLGKIVKTTTVELVEGVNNTKLSLSALANATYIIVLTDEKGYQYKYKVVKQ